MKLNNGKGWEAMKHHPSQHLHAPNALPNPSNVALNGGAGTPRGPGTPGLNPNRLNQPQPLPPSHQQKPGVGGRREKPGAGQLPNNRRSGVLGGQNDVTPAASTQAQFQSSTLPPRTSQANPGMNIGQTPQQGSRAQNLETQPSAMQKIMKVLCCSR